MHYAIKTGGRVAALGLLLLAGCSDEPESAPPVVCEAPAERPYVVTADWLNGSLTLLSMARLVDDACTADDAIVGSVDLSAYPPGPIQLEIAPDGRTAVVSVGIGFFDLLKVVGDPLPDGRALLIVDIDSGEVLHEIDTPHASMGLAISPDGSTAYAANFGRGDDDGRTVSVVDIASGSVEHVDFGLIPEQVALSPDGSRGIVNIVDEGGVRLFDTASVTPSPPLMTGNDPSDVVFIDDTTAMVTHSVSFDYALIDASDPTTPTVIETQPFNTGVPYGATLIPGTQHVLATTFLGKATLVEIDAGARPSTIVSEIALPGGSFPLNAAVDPSGRYAFVAHPSDHTLSVVDRESGAVRSLSWLSEGGPTYTAIAP